MATTATHSRISLRPETSASDRTYIRRPEHWSSTFPFMLPGCGPTSSPGRERSSLIPPTTPEDSFPEYSGRPALHLSTAEAWTTDSCGPSRFGWRTADLFMTLRVSGLL